jgi:uncharacterized protein YuzE
MEIEHNVKADVIYIRFNRKPFHKNKSTANGTVVLDLAEDGSLIGIELISPSLNADSLQEIIYRFNNEDSTTTNAKTS